MKKQNKSRKSKWSYTVGCEYRGIDTQVLEERIGAECDGHGIAFSDNCEDAEWCFKSKTKADKAFAILNRCKFVRSLSFYAFKVK